MANGTPEGQQPGGEGRGVGFLARIMLWAGALSVAFIIFVIWVPINPWFPEGTRQAREVDNLFKFMLASSGVIFIYVQALVLAFALRYRRRRNEPEDALGSQSHGNTRLEITWTVLPSVLLVVLVILSLRVWTDEQASHKNDLRLDVRGFQFGWSFALPQYGITLNKALSTVMLPVNRPVHVYEHSNDVIHSFWVPEFRIKQDVVPGLTTEEHFTPVETGTYRVICTEFCGVGHSGMVTKLTVGTEAQFIAWLRKNGATSLPTGSTTAALAQAHS